MENKLAIVIPAYKGEFLSEALYSIANQGNKNFTVYIGDDASPDQLWDIIEPFITDLNIVYKRFEENIGGANLVKQWDRCINLTDKEEWIWLFSDDDIMEPDCIENFYNCLLENPNYDVFKFHTKVIDENSKVTRDIPFIDEQKFKVDSYIKKRLKNNILSFVIEYVFNKNTFYNSGGFVNFDLAWNSDDATWIKLMSNKGICQIYGSSVLWRASGINISRIEKPEVLERKIKSDIDYAEWLTLYIRKNKIEVHAALIHKWILKRILRYKESKNYISQYINKQKWYGKIYCYIYVELNLQKASIKRMVTKQKRF